MSSLPTEQTQDATAPSVTFIRSEQNFTLAALAGIAAAIVGAALWALVTVAIEMKLGLIAVAVGYLVGQAIRFAGKGIDAKFGYLGAACGLVGCVLGNILSGLIFYAHIAHLDAATLISQIDIDLIRRVVIGTASPMDLVFYAIGIYEGYKFSFKYRLAPAPSGGAPTSAR
jgi:hypothetical protein